MVHINYMSLFRNEQEKTLFTKELGRSPITINRTGFWESYHVSSGYQKILSLCQKLSLFLLYKAQCC